MADPRAVLARRIRRRASSARIRGDLAKSAARLGGGAAAVKRRAATAGGEASGWRRRRRDGAGRSGVAAAGVEASGGAGSGDGRRWEREQVAAGAAGELGWRLGFRFFLFFACGCPGPAACENCCRPYVKTYSNKKKLFFLESSEKTNPSRDNYTGVTSFG